MKSLEIASMAWVLFFVAVLHAEDSPEKPKPASIEIYNLFELLNKAERIVIADIGASHDGRTALVVQKTLKAPAERPVGPSAETLKRAQDLLSGKPDNGPPATAPAVAAPLYVMADPRMKLPPEGTQAIFFLWERAAEVNAGENAIIYRLSHPQCVYDAAVIPEVKAGLSRPRAQADGRYLRDGDKILAEKVKQHNADVAMLEAKGGDVVLGMKVLALRPALSVRGDNSFSVTARVENTRSRSQAVYDGPASAYGVIIRPKDGGSGRAIILHHAMRSLSGTVDSSVLNILDVTDFATVPGESGMSKELFFDAESLPVLKTLHGDYVVNVFCSSQRDGKGLGLDEPVWTGTVVSEGVRIQFR